jgi:uncharacterized protein (DUF362 family)
MIQSPTPGLKAPADLSGNSFLAETAKGASPGSGLASRPLVSVFRDGTVDYPLGSFSPAQRFPEYRFSDLATTANDVYGAVRACLAGAGLDVANFGQPSWNPLGAYIRPGAKVFVLANFVKQDDLGVGPVRFSAKCTHGSVLRAVLDYVLLALNGKGTVHFGNAPIQSCDWDRVVEETGAARVAEFYRTNRSEPPVELIDLRRHVVRDHFGALRVERHADDEKCVAVDLGRDSLLDVFYEQGNQPRFRVLDYDPERTAQCHSRGHHLYTIHRQILESDVIVSVPKLKTHEKVGMTCAIKGCVGAVAHKDCLAHHRFGPPAEFGDEYPDRLSFLGPLSRLHDFANGHPTRWGNLARRLDLISRKVVRRFTRALGGSWSGNDTCWRMAVDLARLLAYADRNGQLCSRVQRQHLSITDGIVAGEGQGPLRPEPVKLGYLAFSDNIVAGDFINCLAMGFDPAHLPLLRGALAEHKYPLIEAFSPDWNLILGGQPATLDGVRQNFTKRFEPPRAWLELLQGSERT